MELQWNFNDENNGEKPVKSVKHINDELRIVVTQIFKNDKDYFDLDLVSKYQQVFETVTFIFEDYRQSFENIMEKHMGNLNQEQHHVEALVFCSWVSIEVMTALSKQVVRT